jgi:F-type H+-transporting ATPase subunit b
MDYFFLCIGHLQGTEGAGGLFDFNATLPLMAIQFIFLTVALTFVWYKPISKVLDERENYINSNLVQASEKLLAADKLCKQYEEQLKEAKAKAQVLIVQAEKETKQEASDFLQQRKAQNKVAFEELNKKLLVDQSNTLQSLDEPLGRVSFQLIDMLLFGRVVSL